MASAWYVLHCKTRQEARAREHVENQGYRTSLPQIRINKLLRGQRIQAIEALFPNYLFVQLNAITANFNALRSTRGVTNFVRFGGMPATVPNKVMEHILALEQTQQSAVKNKLQAGTAVEIIAGPFAGLTAVYTMASGDERCWVLLDMLGKQQRLELKEQTLRAL